MEEGRIDALIALVADERDVLNAALSARIVPDAPLIVASVGVAWWWGDRLGQQLGRQRGATVERWQISDSQRSTVAKADGPSHGASPCDGIGQGAASPLQVADATQDKDAAARLIRHPVQLKFVDREANELSVFVQPDLGGRLNEDADDGERFVHTTIILRRRMARWTALRPLAAASHAVPASARLWVAHQHGSGVRCSVARRRRRCMALTHASVSADTNRDGIIARSNEQEVAVDEGMHAIVPLALVTLAVAMLSGVRVVARRRRHDWDAEGMMYVGLPTYAAAVGAAPVATIVLYVAWVEPQRSITPRAHRLLAAARDASGAPALSILAFREVKTDSQANLVPRRLHSRNLFAPPPATSRR